MDSRTSLLGGSAQLPYRTGQDMGVPSRDLALPVPPNGTQVKLTKYRTARERLERRKALVVRNCFNSPTIVQLSHVVPIRINQSSGIVALYPAGSETSLCEEGERYH